MNKPTKIGLIVFGFVLFGVIAIATTQISDTKFQVGNCYLNTSGLFCTDGSSGKYEKPYQKAYDSMVCSTESSKDTSGCTDVVDGIADDIQLQTALDRKGVVYIRDNLNLQDENHVYSNTTIKSDVMIVFNISKDYKISAANKYIENIKFENIAFKTDALNVHATLINLTDAESVSNLNFNNLDFYNWNNTIIAIQLRQWSPLFVSNIDINNINMIDTRGGIILKEITEERADKIWNVNIKNIHLINTASSYTPLFNTQSYSVFISGGNGVLIENVNAINKSPDGPVLKLMRIHNMEVKNVYSYYQHDYLIDVGEGSENVKIKNAKAEYPRYYGVLYIHNTDYNTSTNGIYAENIQCLNCETGTNMYPISIKNFRYNAEPIRNIVLDNFYINGSNDYGAIKLDTEYGELEYITLKNGIIENVDYAGILLTGGNNSDFVTISNVRIIDAGLTSTDNDKAACIMSNNANVTNFKLENSLCWNKTGTGKLRYGVRVLADTGCSVFEGVFINNDFLGFNNNSFFVQPYGSKVGEIYIDSKVYGAASGAPSSTGNCNSNSTFFGQTITNLSGSTISNCRCTMFGWKCATYS